MKRSVLVRGLPKEISEEKLTIYFQKRRNGGGEVAKVELLDGGTEAIVEFEDEETVTSVLQRSHIMNGKVLKVEKTGITQGGNQLFTKVEAVVCTQFLQKTGLNVSNLSKIAEELNSVAIDTEKRGENYVVIAGSLQALHDFEKKFKAQAKKRSVVSGQSASSSKPLPHRIDKSPTRRKPMENIFQSNAPSPSHDFGNFQSQTMNLHTPQEFQPRLLAASDPDSLTPEWTDRPFPQPQEGQTLVEMVGNGGRNLIKRMFCFNEGIIEIPGDLVHYSAYEVVVILPDVPAGQMIDQMLMQAFDKRKLFYIGRNISGPGFKIQCAYNMFGSEQMGDEVDLTHKLSEIKSRLIDLGIETPQKKVTRKPDKVSEIPMSVEVLTQSMCTTPAGPNRQPPTSKKVGPLPQPDGLAHTAEFHEKDVPGHPGVGAIHLYFRFPGGAIQVEDGKTIHYGLYNRTACLPGTDEGRKLYAMILEAAHQKKLFVVAAKAGTFMIRTKVPLLASDDYPNEEYLQVLYSALLKLGIEPPYSPPPLPQKVEAHYEEVSDDEEEQKQLEVLRKGGPCPQPDNIANFFASLKQIYYHYKPPTSKKVGPLPQPDGLAHTAEFYEKDVPGHPGVGAIHLYFRFPGGAIQVEDGKTIHYGLYNRTACLPGTDEGRKLYAMILEAAHQKKLFVVAAKAGTFMIRTKVPLLASDDYPNEEYLQVLYSALLKLGIEPPYSPPPLPQKVEAHYEEVSDDEEEQKQLEVLRKGGPCPQPDNGVMRLEKEERNLPGLSTGGSIKVYFRFAGGKMKVEGSKPSKSFEVQYSQMNVVAVLPGNSNGTRLAAMLKVTFEDGKLFYVEKREGEPSFRVRPRVTFLTTEDYPNPQYLATLKRELKSLGMQEPSDRDVAGLTIHKSTTPQGGALPPEWAASSATNQDQQNPPIPHLQPQPAQRFSNNGARPKISRVDSLPTKRAPPPASSSRRKMHHSQRRPGFAGTSNSNTESDDAQNTSNSVRDPHPFSNTSVQSYSGLAPNNQPEQKEDDKCAICLGVLSQMPTKRLPCNHEFHKACIDMALKTQQWCPYCNQAVNASGTQSAAQPPVLGMGGAFVQPRTPSPVFNSPFGFYSPPANNTPVFPNHQPRRRTPPRNRMGQSGGQPPHGNMKHHTEGQSLPGYEGCGTIVVRYNIPAGMQQSCHPNPGARYDSTRREAYLPDNADGQAMLKLLERAFNAGLTFTVGQSESSGKDNQIIWNGIPHKTNRHGGTASYGYPDPSYLSRLRRHLASIGIQ